MTTPIDTPAARPAPAWWTGLRDGLRNYPEFVITWLLCSAVPCLANAWIGTLPSDDAPATLLLRLAITALAAVGATFSLAGAAVLLVEVRAGRDTLDLAGAWRRLFARASRLMPIGVCLGLIVFAHAHVREFVHGAHELPRVLLVLGAALLMLGLLVRWAFAPIAAVLEDLPPREAIARSWRVTHRRVWRTTLLILLGYLPDVLIVYLLRDGEGVFPMELARQLAVGLWTPMVNAMLASVWLERVAIPSDATPDEPPVLHVPHEAV